MKYLSLFALAGCLTASLTTNAAPVDWSQLPPASAHSNVTFTNDILPLFKASCVRCHGAERPRAQLRLDSLDGVLKGAKRGPVLTTGDSANSLLVKSISQLDPESAMPPKPRARRGPGGPGGTNAPAMNDRRDGPPGGEGQPPRRGDDDHGPGGERPQFGGGPGERPPGGPEGTNGPGQRPRNFGPPAKPLTAEQVGLVRAWIDQGAK